MKDPEFQELPEDDDDYIPEMPEGYGAEFVDKEQDDD